MQPLVDGHPGKDESWRELAEHSLEHDDLPGTRPVPRREKPAP
jgi:hypothetical protein